MEHRIIRFAFVLLGFLLLVFSAVSCDSAPEPEDETSGIREAIVIYLANTKNLKTDQMDITIEHLDVQKDTASCTSTFVLRNVDGMPPISYQYKLRKTSNKWEVESSEPLSSHGETESSE